MLFYHPIVNAESQNEDTAMSWKEKQHVITKATIFNTCCITTVTNRRFQLSDSLQIQMCWQIDKSKSNYGYAMKISFLLA